MVVRNNRAELGGRGGGGGFCFRVFLKGFFLIEEWTAWDLVGMGVRY